MSKATEIRDLKRAHEVCDFLRSHPNAFLSRHNRDLVRTVTVSGLSEPRYSLVNPGEDYHNSEVSASVHGILEAQRALDEVRPGKRWYLRPGARLRLHDR
jgi:hypothetical protein